MKTERQRQRENRRFGSRTVTNQPCNECLTVETETQRDRETERNEDRETDDSERQRDMKTD